MEWNDRIGDPKPKGAPETSGGIFADTYKSKEMSEKITPEPLEMEDNFPPPREEDAPEERPEHMAPPPVFEPAPSDPIIEQYAKEHPENVSSDYMEELRKGLIHTSQMKAFMTTAFDSQVRKYAARETICTGYDNVDGYIGGLVPGLYVLGAGSGVGKTTFCLQMADSIASRGHDVVYFAMEQNQLELASKSISRLAAQISHIKTEDDRNIITSMKVRQSLIPEEMEAIYEQAKKRYTEEIAPHLEIVHGDFRTGTTKIIEFIEEYRRTKQAEGIPEPKPVIFIDYLQVLEPPEETPKNADRRKQIDDIMFALKNYSEEMPIFVISSLNRSNYTARIDYEAFKESGNIEYTGEVIFGLQMKCINDDDKLFDGAADTQRGAKRKKIASEMEKDPREVELICLKNRYGKRFGNKRRACFKYYPACDLFEVDYSHVVPHLNHAGGGKPRL